MSEAKNSSLLYRNSRSHRESRPILSPPPVLVDRQLPKLSKLCIPGYMHREGGAGLVQRNLVILSQRPGRVV